MSVHIQIVAELLDAQPERRPSMSALLDDARSGAYTLLVPVCDRSTHAESVHRPSGLQVRMMQRANTEQRVQLFCRTAMLCQSSLAQMSDAVSELPLTCGRRSVLARETCAIDAPGGPRQSDTPRPFETPRTTSTSSSGTIPTSSASRGSIEGKAVVGAVSDLPRQENPKGGSLALQPDAPVLASPTLSTKAPASRACVIS